jgi:hypothetical protein
MKRHKDATTFGHDPLNTELQFATKVLLECIEYREAHSRSVSKKINNILLNRKLRLLAHWTPSSIEEPVHKLIL